MNQFKAPWGMQLRIASTLSTVLLVGISVYYAFAAAPNSPKWVGLLPGVLLAGSLLFMVRGYTITGDTLLVQRLVWSTQLPLARLQSAEYQPLVTRRSIRLFGNGGMSSFTGLYRNKSLGNYRAYVTDLNRTVVLTFPDRRIVVSPDAREEFVRVLNQLHGCPA